MICPPELSVAMHADGGLQAHEAVEMEQHLAGCERCRTHIGMLRAESRIFAAALVYDPMTVVVPAFQRPLTAGVVLVGAVATIVVAVMLSVMQGLIGSLVPEIATWFNPFDSGGIANLVVRLGIFLTQHGDTLVTSIAQTVAVSVILIVLAWLAAILSRRIRGPLVVAAVLCVLTLQPTSSEAVEIRHNEEGAVLVAAGETVDDTLIAFGDTVEVNGDVEGDLIAFGRRVVIRGNVAGLVITGAQTVTVDGTIDGSVLAGAETLDVSSSRIGRNLFAGGETVTVSEATNIEQNALVGGEKVSLAGRVGRDVFGAAEDLEVGSTIGRTLTAYTGRLTLLAPARITGDVHAHGLEEKDHVVVSPGAVIGGELVTKFEEFESDENRYETGGFYLSRLLWLAAAFVTGFVLFTVVPRLRRVSIADGGDALRAGAYGIVVLVATPVIAVLVCLTLIGIPLGLIALLLWGAGIYLAKVMVAQLIGTHFVEAMAQSRKHFAVALAFGLLVVTFLTNLPFVGGVFGFLVTVLGLGLLALFVRDKYRVDDMAEV